MSDLDTDDLAAVEAAAWQALETAIADRRSAHHLVKVATVTLDGRPSLRTVVLRGVDRTARTLRFHTDRRSGKVGEIENNPAVGMLFYDQDWQVQVRIDGVARLHAGDTVARDAWARSRPASRACYLASQRPGTVVDAPPAAPAYEDMADPDAFANFCAVVVCVERLEWLYLRASGHQRAQFEWAANGQTTAVWLSP